MSAVCPVCGLPKDVCICGDIAKAQQKVIVRTEKKRYGKLMTKIEGIDGKNVNLKKLSKKLKQELACGGTVKKGNIELQGDHRQRAKALLIKSGFNKNNIEVV